MTATTFDVRAFNRRTGDVASALLNAIDVRDLENREASVAEREADVTRREKSIDRIERMHQLTGVAVTVAPAALESESEVAAASTSVAPRPPEQTSRRHAFQDAFRLRELEWWTKVLGVTPIS